MKIAILGTENSHALAFAKIIASDPAYSDVEIVGVYGYDEEANQKLIDGGYTSYSAKSYDEFVGKVDCVLVTARHGDHHYEYAMPYLKAGIHAFIDKPFAIKIENAREMLETAKKSGSLVCGGSSLKFMKGLRELGNIPEGETIVAGNVCAPINMDNIYGGFYFYSHHLVEMVLTVFGEGVRSVIASCPDVKKNRVSVIFRYDDFDVTANYNSSYCYSAHVTTNKKSYDVNSNEGTGDLYAGEVAEIFDMIKSGVLPESHERLLLPVKIVNAIERSYLEKREIEII